MRGSDDGQPRQIAHIRIHLDRIPTICEQVLEASLPFGRILAEGGIAVERRDRRFLEFPASAAVSRQLNSAEGVHFSRRYTLTTGR